MIQKSGTHFTHNIRRSFFESFLVYFWTAPFSVIEQKLDEAWRQWHEEKKELLHKLEESQREHARTVVTARQSERLEINLDYSCISSLKDEVLHFAKSTRSAAHLPHLVDLPRPCGALLATNSNFCQLLLWLVHHFKIVDYYYYVLIFFLFQKRDKGEKESCRKSRSYCC